MGTELTLDLVQSQMRPQQRLTISEDTVAEIQRLAENPDYGQEFCPWKRLPGSGNA